MSSDEEINEDVMLVTASRFEEYKKSKLPLFIGLSLINAILSFLDGFITINSFTLTIGSIISAGTHIGYLYTFRSNIILPLRLRFSLPRKIISTWTNRLVYFLILVLFQFLRPFPVIAALVPLGGAILILLNTFLAYRYNRWQFEREMNGKGLLLAEKVFILSVASTFMVFVILMTIFLYYVGLGLECMVDPECSLLDQFLRVVNYILQKLGIGTIK